MNIAKLSGNICAHVYPQNDTHFLEANSVSVNVTQITLGYRSILSFGEYLLFNMRSSVLRLQSLVVSRATFLVIYLLDVISGFLMCTSALSLALIIRYCYSRVKFIFCSIDSIIVHLFHFVIIFISSFQFNSPIKGTT